MLHPLLEKRHRIYATWWGRRIRSDDYKEALRDSLILSTLCLFIVSREWSPAHVAWMVLAGFVGGTLFEYITHRWTFHQLWKVPGFRGLEDIHVPHHLEKNDGINAGPFFTPSTTTRIRR